tara:strand:- start:193 stop:819 length:627 start_codon:yes stop_codon:yes gene_type:complete
MMMRKARVNTILRFLNCDLNNFKNMANETSLRDKELTAVTMVSKDEAKEIFDVFGGNSWEQFKTRFEVKITKSSSTLKKHIPDDLKPTNQELKEEFNNVNSIGICLNNNLIDYLKLSINEFEKKSSFRNNQYFLLLKEESQKSIISEQIKEQYLYLLDFFRYKDEEITLEKIQTNEEDNDYLNDKDSNNEEAAIMRAYKEGEQDKFGY